MKKLLISSLVVLLLTETSYAGSLSSIIQLDGGGTITPFSTFKINVDPIYKNVVYSILCNIVNEGQESVDIRLDIDMPHGDWLKFYLNDKKLSHRQGTVRPGTSTTRSDIVAFANGNYVTFTNLDDQNKVTINNCIAKPVIGLSYK